MPQQASLLVVFSTDLEMKFQFRGHFRTFPVILADCWPLSQYSGRANSLPGRLTMGEAKFQFSVHFRSFRFISADCRRLSQYSGPVSSLPGRLTMAKGVSTGRFNRAFQPGVLTGRFNRVFQPGWNSGQHCYWALGTSRGLVRGKCHQNAIALVDGRIRRGSIRGRDCI